MKAYQKISINESTRLGECWWSRVHWVRLFLTDLIVLVGASEQRLQHKDDG